MSSDTIDTSDFYSTVERFDSISSPNKKEKQSRSNVTIVDNATLSPEIKPDVKPDKGSLHDGASPSKIKKKRKDDLFDDFFALGEPTKKKKKHRKHKFQSTSSDVTSSNKDTLIEVTESPLKYIESSPFQIDEKNLEIQEVVSEKADMTSSDEDLVTLPTFNKENFIQEQIKKRSMKRSDRSSLQDDAVVIEDDDINFLQSTIVSTQYITEHDMGTGTYLFNDKNESKRRYVIDVVSKIVDSSDIKAEFLSSGTKRFSNILPKILSFFRGSYSHSASIQSLYAADKISLIWIDGKMEIKPFFKPSTLRIYPDERNKKNTTNTVIRCLLIPKEKQYSFASEYPEFQSNSTSGILTSITGSLNHIDVDTGSGDEHEGIVDFANGDRTIKQEVDKSEDYITIGLKGNDNKRIEVEVSASTKIKNLLSYFIEKKNLSLTETELAKARLVFDDEVLDFEGVVGDTELEDDFEVQVFL